MARKGMTPKRAARVAKVIALYDADHTFAQIANALNVSETQVRNDYRDGIREVYRPAAEERIGKLERQYQTLRRRWWQKAIEGDSKAAEIILKAMRDERALFGLDMPQKHEIAVDGETSTLAEQVTAALNDLAGLGDDDD